MRAPAATCAIVALAKARDFATTDAAAFAPLVRSRRLAEPRA